MYQTEILSNGSVVQYLTLLDGKVVYVVWEEEGTGRVLECQTK